MKIVKNISEVREIINQQKSQGKTVGFVPTMGYLHEGHASLMRKAKSECGYVVVSIFVNPTQFGPNEDYEKYPRDFERDSCVCDDAGVDLMFLPEVGEMYPSKGLVYADVDVLGDRLCGASRPGHFRGVLSVVLKLFNIVIPHKAYFGQKDAQQLIIIKQMTKDFNIPVEIVPCPIVREEDGLALSSRNTYLTKEQRVQAPIIFEALEMARKMLVRNEEKVSLIKESIRSCISKAELANLDYIEVVSFETLQPLESVTEPVLVAVAVFFGKTRLIDNFVYRMDGGVI